MLTFIYCQRWFYNCHLSVPVLFKQVKDFCIKGSYTLCKGVIQELLSQVSSPHLKGNTEPCSILYKGVINKDQKNHNKHLCIFKKKIQKLSHPIFSAH